MLQVAGGRRIEIEMVRIDLPRDPGQGARQQASREHRRRHVGGEVDHPLLMGLTNRHEHAATLDAAHQSPPFEGGIGLGHRPQADLQLPGKIAMGGQAVAALQSPFDDVVGQCQYQPLGGARIDVRKARRPWRLKKHAQRPGILIVSRDTI